MGCKAVMKPKIDFGIERNSVWLCNKQIHLIGSDFRFNELEFMKIENTV